MPCRSGTLSTQDAQWLARSISHPLTSLRSVSCSIISLLSGSTCAKLCKCFTQHTLHTSRLQDPAVLNCTICQHSDGSSEPHAAPWHVCFNRGIAVICPGTNSTVGKLPNCQLPWNYTGLSVQASTRLSHLESYSFHCNVRLVLT